MQGKHTRLILPEGILTTLDGSQLLPIQTNRYTPKASVSGVSVVELGKLLIVASKEGNIREVKDLMNRGAPFTTDWLGSSPLHFAALHNHYEACELLLRAGISRDSRNKVEKTPLHMAACEGHINIVDLLLLNGASIDTRDMLRMTPLHWAVQREHVDLITLLLKKGANRELLNKFDKTPMDIAVDLHRHDILEILQTVTKETSESPKNIIIDSMKPLENEGEFKEIEIEEDFEQKLEESINSSEVESLTTNNKDVDYTDSLQMLKDHGISYLPVENSSIVATAVENGHSLVLTEAGKQVLNSTKPVIRLHKNQITELNANQLITLEKEHLKAFAKSMLIVKKTNKKQKHFQSKITILGSPLLPTTAKRVKLDMKSISNKPIAIAPATARVASVSNTVQMTKPSSINSTITVSPTTVKIAPKTVYTGIPANIQTIQKQLEEARRETEKYKLMLKNKEEEAEKYKKQLQSFVAKSK